MPRIALLSEALVNKIAAGEVVERPASVIKELCENAVDAGATEIRVAIAGGGLDRITVHDDGVGMGREDAELCLVRHATSKLRDVEGLFEIQTMGFRGEAIPSIASVSRFSLLTSERGAPTGTEVIVEGGSVAEVRDAAPIGGTRIRVEDLFFNTPARRKFLRREETEAKYSEEAVIRLALAHPEVAFTFESAGKTLFASRGSEGDLRERIAAALGAEAHPHLVEVAERRLGLAISGFVSGPAHHLPNARGLYTFVNRRYVRDRGLNHSIQRAFSEFLPPGRQPLAVLFLDLDPRAVDVNVHPQKLEVRFADGKGVYDALHAAVSRAVREAAAREAAALAVPTLGAGAPAYSDAVDRFLSRAQQGGWGAPIELPLPSVADAPSPSFGQLYAPDVNQAPPEGYFAQLRFLGEVGRRFWVCEGRGGGVVVVDPHAAAERLAHHRLAEALALGTAAPQGSLFSASVELSPSEARQVQAALPELHALGLELEPFGGTSFALKSVPAPLEGVAAHPLLQAISGALAAGADRARLLQLLACHAAERRASEAEAPALLKALSTLPEDAFASPLRHGQVVVSELTLPELERRTRVGG